jgi:phospholipid-binding lipoprotein MlaA
MRQPGPRHNVVSVFQGTSMFNTSWMRRCLAIALLGGLLTGCATGPDANPRDPLEPFNRGVSVFNDAVDGAVLKPVAIAYRDAAPELVQTGVNNFFGNLGDVLSAANATLQLRPRVAVESLMRVSINTVLGLGGLLDIATEMGLLRTRVDFGQTLGRWGLPSGPYLVMPIFGPSSVRDASGFVVDSSGDLVGRLSDVSARNSLTALRVVDARAGLLRATSLLESAALDKYSFTRDFYLQRRESQIEDILDQGMGLPEVGPDTQSSK